jgi:hypothetical protein
MTKVNQPQLVIKVFGRVGEDIYELEEARSLLNFDLGIIQVEGQRVFSCEELMRLARDKYADRQSIEIMLLPTIMGG